MHEILRASPHFTNCSGIATPRSFQLVSSDPNCRVSIVTSPDGTTPGPAVVRVLSPQATDVTWDANDWLAFVVTAGKDNAPIVAVSGSSLSGSSGPIQVTGAGGP